MKHTTHIQQIRHLMNWKESQLTKAAYCQLKKEFCWA